MLILGSQSLPRRAGCANFIWHFLAPTKEITEVFAASSDLIRWPAIPNPFDEEDDAHDPGNGCARACEERNKRGETSVYGIFASFHQGNGDCQDNPRAKRNQQP